MAFCSRCNDQRFTVVEGKKVACPCVKARRLLVYATNMLMSVNSLPEVMRSQLSSIVWEQNVHIQLAPSVPEAVVDGLKLFYLLAQGMPVYKVFNVYELMEIYLDNHPDYKSIFEIHLPATILTEGYNEFPNRRLPEIILQYADIARRDRNGILFISLKPSTDPNVMEYMKTHKWQFLTQATLFGNQGGEYSRV